MALDDHQEHLNTAQNTSNSLYHDLNALWQTIASECSLEHANTLPSRNTIGKFIKTVKIKLKI